MEQESVFIKNVPSIATNGTAWMHPNLTPELNHRVISTLGIFSRAASMMVALIGALGLLGWAFDIGFFKSIFPDVATMKPNTAACFILAGVALWLLKSEQADSYAIGIASFCSVIITGVASLTLSEYIFSADLGIDDVLFQAATLSPSGQAHPLRMSQITAINFLGVGLALLFLDFQRFWLVSFVLSVMVQIISLMALVGYLYDAKAVYAIGPFDTIALPTALGFAVMSGGALSARPQRGFMRIIASATPGGIMVRHILPLALAAPVVLGWLRLVGQETGLYNTAFGLCMHVVSLIVIFTFVVLRSGRSLMALDEQRLQAEDKLSRNRAHLLASQRIARLGSWELEPADQEDVTAGRLYWSDEVFRIFGYAPGQIEVSNENFFRAAHPDDRAAIQAAIAKAIETHSQYNIDHRIILPDGAERTVHEQSQILYDEETGRPLKMIGTVQDITDRKMAENALRESEERFSAFMAHSPAMTWIKDDRFRLVFVNTAFEKAFNRSRETMLGKTDFDFMSEETARQIRANDMQVMTTGEALQKVEVIATPDEMPRQWLVCKFVFRAKDGRKFLGGISSDITRLKQTEEALAHNVKELARSNAELQQFANVASHDLQEPLRMVSSYLQLLERRYKGNLDADAEEFIGYAVEGARRMKGLIGDLLAYSRVGADERRLASTSSEAALKRAIENLQFSANKSGLRLTHDPLPALRADGSQLVQLFQNLIGNALKFKSEKSPEVHVGAELKGGEWVFSISDNGIGIDPKYVDRIFEIFKRLHNRNAYPGNGIGLAICKKIVERHGGRIWAESQLGKGATFYFTIPSGENNENGHSGKARHEHISFGQTG